MIFNLTQQAIPICDAAGNLVRVYPKSENTISLAPCTVPAGALEDGTPLTRTEFRETELPEYKEGTYYIVSPSMKSALPNRSDLLIPAEQVRNSITNIVLGYSSLGV